MKTAPSSENCSFNAEPTAPDFSAPGALDRLSPTQISYLIHTGQLDIEVITDPAFEACKPGG